jgi:hypothetical protein
MVSCLILGTLIAMTDPALLIAQSCVGEAGFGSAETGECIAIAHIYRKRAALCNHNIEWIARRYSAAIKSGGHMWVRSLRRDGRRPHGWPQRLDWSRYRGYWWSVLDQVDAFVRGETVDPLPAALHYGGSMDRGLDLQYWRWIPVDRFRNRFYKRRHKK